jgi:hypothetical protein
LEPGLGHVGFAVNKMELEQIFLEYFGFHRLLNDKNRLSSVAGAIGQKSDRSTK